MQKQRLFGSLALVTIVIIVFAVSCSKTGPAGATGPQGTTGPQGPTGSQGPEGNANVLVDTFTLVNSQWIYNSQYYFETSPGSYTEYFTRYYDITDSAVTQSILNTGEVMVFFVPNPIANANQWAPLPYVFLDGSGNFTYNVAFQTFPYKVELEYFFNQLKTVAPPNLSTYDIPTYKFKIVVISGTISTAMEKAGIDKGNYAQVSAYLNFSKSAGRPSPNRPGAGRN
jgi:hypothetical protein